MRSSISVVQLLYRRVKLPKCNFHIMSHSITHHHYKEKNIGFRNGQYGNRISVRYKKTHTMVPFFLWTQEAFYQITSKWSSMKWLSDLVWIIWEHLLHALYNHLVNSVGILMAKTRSFVVLKEVIWWRPFSRCSSRFLYFTKNRHKCKTVQKSLTKASWYKSKSDCMLVSAYNCNEQVSFLPQECI